VRNRQFNQEVGQKAIAKAEARSQKPEVRCCEWKNGAFMPQMVIIVSARHASDRIRGQNDPLMDSGADNKKL